MADRGIGGELHEALERVEEHSARYIATQDETYRLAYQDQRTGKDFQGLGVLELAAEVAAIADEIEPDTAATRRLRATTMAAAAEAFLAGDPDRQRVLVERIGRSPGLRWAMSEYLRTTEVVDAEGYDRALAAVLVIVEDYDDFRDLVLWLVEPAKTLLARGIDVASGIDRMQPLASGPTGQQVFRSLRLSLAGHLR